MSDPVGNRGALSLVELLASLAILSVIIIMMFGIIHQTGSAWRGASSKIEGFQGARSAFEALTQNLGQATLNTYYDYYDAKGSRRTPENASTFVPATYGRYSDLHFVSGHSLIAGQISHAMFFQTPAGYSNDPAFQSLDTIINATGYYVKFDREDSAPDFLSTVPNLRPMPYRYRLMQFLEPSQELKVYDTTTKPDFWFTRPIADGKATSRQIASNVIALVVRPKRSEQDPGSPLAPEFGYDSRMAGASGNQLPTQHQLPPLVEVFMIVIDEPSALRLDAGAAPPELGVSSCFKTESELQGDLKNIEFTLTKKRLTYRIFKTVVPLRNSKWSS